ncbi:MAG: hypothetical protein FWG10_03260 [Eubacteriaceae bacterium]|nr:hypothetical protein [Eubacteriaceae bacterium]
MARCGLVLSSDGAKSSFEIGAWRAIRELDIEITTVAGSFVGALNAALIAQGSFDTAVKFWGRALTSQMFYDTSSLLVEKYTNEWSIVDVATFRKSFADYIGSGAEELRALRDAIAFHIDEKTVRVSGTSLSFVSLALDKLAVRPITLDEVPDGQLAHYLLAATCYPQIAHSTRIFDSMFSIGHSPFKSIDIDNVDLVLTTDEVAIIPPHLRPLATIIKSNEILEFSAQESLDAIKHKIKNGHIETLKLFAKSLGNYFYIVEGPQVEFDIFCNKLGSPLPAHLGSLVEFMLSTDIKSRRTILNAMSSLAAQAGIESADIALALLENIGRFLGIAANEKHSKDRLLALCVETSKKLLEAAKYSIMEHNTFAEILANIEDPGNNLPGPELFMKYFLLFISAKPDKYPKLQHFLSCLHQKTILALATLLYIYYAA